MPAKTKKQIELKKNKGVLKMSHKQLHDFASTKGLSSTAPHANIIKTK